MNNIVMKKDAFVCNPYGGEVFSVNQQMTSVLDSGMNYLQLLEKDKSSKSLVWLAAFGIAGISTLFYSFLIGVLMLAIIPLIVMNMVRKEYKFRYALMLINCGWIEASDAERIQIIGSIESYAQEQRKEIVSSTGLTSNGMDSCKNWFVNHNFEKIYGTVEA